MNKTETVRETVRRDSKTGPRVIRQSGMTDSKNTMVERFLKLAEQSCFFRGEPFHGTRLKIESNDGKLRIAYEFTKTEIAILQTLSEVTGVSVNWLAKDAVDWTRVYINDLPMKGNGQVFDLIEDRADFVGATCHKIPPTHRHKTRAFIEALKRAWA